MTSKSATVRLLAGVALVALISGCANTPLETGPERLSDRPISERTPGASTGASEALNIFKEKPVTILETDGRHEFEIFMDAGDEVPPVTVGELNASPMSFPELLNQITEQVGMSWIIAGTNRDELMSKDIYFVQRSETYLESVLEEISKSTSSFYRIDGDRIVFSQDELFITNVPRMADSLDVLTAGISNVGAADVFSDKLTGTISFRANRETLAAVQALMRSFEQGRDMIVYDFWIIERTLTDSSGLGVEITTSFATDQGDFSLSSSGGTGLVGAVGASAVEAGFFTGNLGNVAVEAAANMVRALGDTETLARPTISMLSGASSSFESGEKSEYIRSINAESSDSSTSTGTDVEELNVGIKVEVEGAHNGGVISTAFDLDISELIAFDEFDTGEVRLRLPRTSERKLTAHLEARPGDLLALGGIIRDRTSKTEKGLGAQGVPIARGSDAQKTETIILVRPRLVQIRPGENARVGEVLRVQSGVTRAPNALSGVMSEEARTKRLLEELKAK